MGREARWEPLGLKWVEEGGREGGEGRGEGGESTPERRITQGKHIEAGAGCHGNECRQDNSIP